MKMPDNKIGYPAPEEQDRLASEQDQEIGDLIDEVGLAGTRAALEGATAEEVLEVIQDQEAIEGAPNEVVPTPFREMTDAEIAWTNPKTPRRYKERVRVACEDGNVASGLVKFEDGLPLTNVVRVVLVMATTMVPGSSGVATAMITQYHNEIGACVYTEAEALIGIPSAEDQAEKDQGAPALDLTDDPVDETDRPLVYGHDLPERRFWRRLDGDEYEGPNRREEDGDGEADPGDPGNPDDEGLNRREETEPRRANGMHPQGLDHNNRGLNFGRRESDQPGMRSSTQKNGETRH